MDNKKSAANSGVKDNLTEVKVTNEEVLAPKKATETAKKTTAKTTGTAKKTTAKTTATTKKTTAKKLRLLRSLLQQRIFLLRKSLLLRKIFRLHRLIWDHEEVLLLQVLNVTHLPRPEDLEM